MFLSFCVLMIFSIKKKIGFWGILGPPYCFIGATIRIGREMLCLTYSGFLKSSCQYAGWTHHSAAPPPQVQKGVRPPGLLEEVGPAPCQGQGHHPLAHKTVQVSRILCFCHCSSYTAPAPAPAPEPAPAPALDRNLTDCFKQGQLFSGQGHLGPAGRVASLFYQACWWGKSLRGNVRSRHGFSKYGEFGAM